MKYTETGFIESARLKRESVFHTSSGLLGIRGCFEEGAPEGGRSIRGAYLNGFCETEPVLYNERLHGFPDTKQQIVCLPDAQTIRLKAGDEDIVCWNGSELVQTLDMENGLSERSFAFQTAQGRIRVCFRRMVSFVYPDVFVIECQIESVDFDGEITVESTLEPEVRNYTDPDDPRVASGDGRLLKTIEKDADAGFLQAVCETERSGRKVLCLVTHGKDEGFVLLPPLENAPLAAHTTCFVQPGKSVCLHKYCLYREIADIPAKEKARDDLGKIRDLGFEALTEKQHAYLEAFWNDSRVTVDGKPELQTQLDFCLYQMLQAAGKNGLSSVPAKGLSGEGYEGHYFWDSEIYVFPFFLMTEPKIARALLEYRYHRLNDARGHAAELGHTCGALYPWRTIAGSECSSYYPSGSAQYHINGDIAHAFLDYWRVTHDESFLEQTCEVLVETARLWIDTGHWLEGSFRIDCVTGPDEYTCVVNNNYYTNACAAENLTGAFTLCEELKKDPEKYCSFAERLGLDNDETEAFRVAGEHMYFPHGGDPEIIAQDDSFLSKKHWDLKSIPRENFPLLMHYHPLLINRYQVLKQADSVLANCLYREEDVLTMMRSYRYYEAITTHDSSLSHCIYAIMAVRLGDLESAKRYFAQCVGTDTEDLHGNTRDGLHLANIGGVHRVMIAGFGGIRVSDQGLSFFPILPDDIPSIRFPIYWRGSRLMLSVTGDECRVRVTDGMEQEITVYGQRIIAGYQETAVKRCVEGVVFDLDGVITDTARFHYLAWKELAEDLGIPFDEKRNEAFKGISRADCLKMLLSWGCIEADEKRFNELLMRKNDLYLKYMEQLREGDTLPGIAESLALLRNAGIPIALFSVSKNTDRILEKLGLTHAFDAVVTGLDIRLSKPHFEGYMMAAERLGVDHRLCMMVEDSVAGISGARAISMKTLALMAENKAKADWCLPSTAELPDFLANMFR